MEATSAIALLSALCLSASAAWNLSRQAVSFMNARTNRKRALYGSDTTGFAGDMSALKSKVGELLNRSPRVRNLVNQARRARYRQHIRRSLPQVIRLLCIALDSGSSLTKSLEYAADNSSGPIAKELRQAVWSLRAGQSFDEAMEGLRLRTGGSEFSCLAVAMEIQHRCGGTLSTILESVSRMLQQTSDLEDELITKTTQAQLSARVVAVMPLVVLALLSVISPGYLGQFFQSAASVAILLLAVVLEAVGVVLVKRSLAVDLGIEAM